MELVILAPLILLLVCPSPSLVLGFYSAAMIDQRILENKCVGSSPVAVHAITKNFGGGGQTFYSKITDSNDNLWMTPILNCH